ncbi:MAG: hypothetical protein K8R79_05670 [Calditrichales bacterium]|nr:hypothetical protein [Calditrichales bacterium]
MSRDTLKEVGKKFDIDGDSTGSSVMTCMKKKLAGDRKFYRRLDKIVELIKMS